MKFEYSQQPDKVLKRTPFYVVKLIIRVPKIARSYRKETNVTPYGPIEFLSCEAHITKELSSHLIGGTLIILSYV